MSVLLTDHSYTSEGEDNLLLQLSSALDSHTLSLRKHLLELFTGMRLRFQRTMEAELRQEQERHTQVIESYKAQCIALQADLTNRTQQLDILKQQTRELLAVTEERTAGFRAYCAAQKAFSHWRMFVQRKRQSQSLEICANHQQRRETLRRTIHRWRCHLERRRQIANMAQCRATCESTVERVQTEATAEVTIARQQVIALQDALAMERDNRLLLEERLKAAFMKGVCALNMEAMQVLRPDSSQGESVLATTAKASSSGLTMPPVSLPPWTPEDGAGTVQQNSSLPCYTDVPHLHSQIDLSLQPQGIGWPPQVQTTHFEAHQNAHDYLGQKSPQATTHDCVASVPMRVSDEGRCSPSFRLEPSCPPSSATTRVGLKTKNASATYAAASPSIRSPASGASAASSTAIVVERNPNMPHVQSTVEVPSVHVGAVTGPVLHKGTHSECSQTRPPAHLTVRKRGK